MDGRAGALHQGWFNRLHPTKLLASSHTGVHAMKAIVCSAYGPPESLQLLDIAAPAPGPGQVLIRTQVAAVNFPDTLIIQGRYQFKPALPFTPGGEVAGRVSAVGSGVEHVQVGDTVVALCIAGGFAEEVAVDAQLVAPLPKGLSDAEIETAGSMTMTYGTSLHALKDRALVQAGETLLVLGAAGGVGLAAVEIGKLLGMKVIAAASSPEKLEVARAHGADELIDYSRDDLRERIKAITAGRGVDVVYDPVGGAYTEPALRSVGWRGRYLVVGFAAGEIPQIPINLMLLKGSAMLGVFWGEFVRREPRSNLANMRQLFEWLQQGNIHPLISARYALADTPRALQALQSRQVTGKVVVLPGS
jgi:NADPH:quinone reductase